MATATVLGTSRGWPPGCRTGSTRAWTACGSSWHVEIGNLLICERNPEFYVAVAMGEEPVERPPGTVLASAVPLRTDGWLEADNAAWVMRT